MVIRPFQPGDEVGAYAVCLGTGDDGRDAGPLYRDPMLLGHVYVGPYLRLRPSFASVLVDGDGVVVGYVVGVPDTIEFEREAEESWWPELRERYPAGRSLGGRDDELVGIIHSPYGADPRLVARYPAHLHIDLLPVAQGRGLGKALMARVLSQLADAGAIGVHLFVSVTNTKAIGFYEALGFARALDVPGAVLMTRALPT